MLKETDGRGPYSSLIMAVVIVKDVLVFACFAVNIETSRVVRPCSSRINPKIAYMICLDYIILYISNRSNIACSINTNII